MQPKRISFSGFLMDMAAGGVKDSEGAFTVSARASVDRLKEQFAGDPLLAYTELLQGFRELGASEVRILPRAPCEVHIAASFPAPGPDLGALLADPMNLLSAGHVLHGGTSLLLLQHDEDEMWWSRWGDVEPAHWRFDPAGATFELMPGPSAPPVPRGRGDGGRRTWRLLLKARRRLSLFPADRLKCWKDTPVAQEFVDRMAFYGVPTVCAGQPMQTPIPGRLVPVDYHYKHATGPVGYSWEPLAFELVAGASDSSMSFLSEPFTGAIAEVVSVDGEVRTGFSAGAYPHYVSLKGFEQRRTATRIPFQRRRFFGKTQLAAPGFESFPTALINPRQEGGLLRVHCWGRPLYCSRLTMLSSALGGPSTLVFLRHGAVLGARHENLGVPGTLCLIGTEGLTSDLSRRAIRQDEVYRSVVAETRRRCLLFATETAENLPRGHWARKRLSEHLSAGK